MSQNQSRYSSPQEALSKVKEAEAKAGLLVQNARDTESVQILQDAQEDAHKVREALLSEARRSAEQQKTTAVKNAEAEALRIRQETEAELQSLRKAVEPLIPGAVTKTKEKIVLLLGNRPV